MSARPFKFLLCSLAMVLLFHAPAEATTLLKLDLEELVARSGMIFRGTVVDVSPGFVTAGGGQLPAVTVSLRVDEGFKGTFIEKDGVSVAVITMVGTIKEGAHMAGNAQRFSVLPAPPRLETGSDYLLFVTPRSAIGLSTAVGLGQGAFLIFNQEHQEVALNEYNNQNLGIAGATPYAELAAQVRAMLGK